MLCQTLLSALLLFILPASAQFQFFEQMFNQGGRQQQQQPQNAGSDSAWYQQRYEDGVPRSQPFSSMRWFKSLTTLDRSTLRQIPLPTHAQLRPLPAPLPVRFSGCRGQD